MTTHVRFCLSYDCFKQTFIALKVELASVEQNDIVRDDFMTICGSNQEFCMMWL